jgi:hypothetical protein
VRWIAMFAPNAAWIASLRPLYGIRAEAGPHPHGAASVRYLRRALHHPEGRQASFLLWKTGAGRFVRISRCGTDHWISTADKDS